MSSAIKKINVNNNTFTVKGETNSLKMYLFIREVIFISLFEADAGWWESDHIAKKVSRLRLDTVS
jgi:hypothetical protein